MSYHSDRIGKSLGLSVTYWEYFDRLPLDVQAATLGAIEALKASEDNQVAFPSQDITIFIVQYWGSNGRVMQDYFTCPMSAARHYQYVIANNPESDASISTETVCTKQYQPERD